MKTKEILSTVGTFVVIGAASTAGAALWTNVLQPKIQEAKTKLSRQKEDKVIIVNFKKARRDASR